MIPKEEWDKFWLKSQANQKLVRRELQSSRFKLIRSILEEKFGSLSQLEIIEIGSGMGNGALALAISGAKPTLLDYSELALEKAASFFQLCGLKPKLINCDVFQASQQITEKFDVCLSFDLAEHFTGEERWKIIEAHFNLIKEGGMVIIAVPNRFCLPYLVAKWIRKWQEIPFTKSELKDIAQKMDAQDIAIYGCSLIAFINALIAGLLGMVVKKLKQVSLIPDVRLGFLDSYFGYALLLIASRRASKVAKD
ncbi:class I SAM-dependent methyltransferase [Chloroflexota bacterium]